MATRLRVAAQVIEHLCGAAKGWFRVDDPLRVSSGREPGGERSRVTQRFELAMEAQRAGVERAAQLVEKEPPEEPREHPNGQEEAGPAGDPALAVRGDAAAGYDAVHVRMVQQVLPPRVQDRDEADLRAQVLRIGGDRAQRLGAGAKQQIVERLLVLVRERGDRAAGSVKTTWKYSTSGSSSACRRSSHCARASDWHFGQWRWRHES